MIYMDNAATTCPNELALERMKEIAKAAYFNPSSHHDGGFAVKELMNAEREDIAEMLGAKPYEIYFTSGGTESDNWALQYMAENGRIHNKHHIIASAFEHHAILHKLEQLGKLYGISYTLVKPDKDGRVSPDDIEKAITEDTIGVSVMWVNNEIGTVQPINEIGNVCAKHGVLFHVDAVQAIPHFIPSLGRSNIDLLSASAHKFNGPRGIGFLYVDRNISITPLILGGAQEMRKRAGTENVAGVVGLATALRERQKLISTCSEKMAIKNNILKNGLKSIKGCKIHAENGTTIPTIVNFYFEDILGEIMLSLLNSDGIFCSAGSACASGDPEPSHVLKAIGCSDKIAKNSIRLSFDYNTTEEEIAETIRAVQKNVNFIRGV